MTLSIRFEQALTSAALVHAGQVRKGTGIPYISHVLMVAAMALDHGADEDEAVGALLHDAAEDGGGKPRLEDIRLRFGKRVADIVEGCTDTFENPKPDYAIRKAAYIEHLRREEDMSVLLVAACDKLVNSRAILRDYREIGEAVWHRFKGGRDATLQYYRALADVFRDKMATSPVVKEFVRVVAEIEAASAHPA